MPAVSPMSAAPTLRHQKKNQKRANLKLRLAYGRWSKYLSRVKSFSMTFLCSPACPPVRPKSFSFRQQLAKIAHLSNQKAQKHRYLIYIRWCIPHFGLAKIEARSHKALVVPTELTRSMIICVFCIAEMHKVDKQLKSIFKYFSIKIHKCRKV